jgi:hypothetical protein
MTPPTRLSSDKTRGARARLVLVVASTLASTAIGCGGTTSPVSNACPAIAATGGNPVGTWVVTDSCQQPYAQTMTPDWCSQLVYTKGTAKDGLFLGQAFLPIDTTTGMDAMGKFTAKSWVSYVADPACPMNDCGQYSAKLTFAGMTTTKFPLGCLQQHNPNPTCADLQKGISELVTLPNIENVSCTPDDAGGCDCTYLVTNDTIVGDVGTWRIVDGLMMHYPSLPNILPPETSDFAVEGTMMQLHGHAGVPLLAHDPLRTLTLVRGPDGFMPTP